MVAMVWLKGGISWYFVGKSRMKEGANKAMSRKTLPFDATIERPRETIRSGFWLVFLLLTAAIVGLGWFFYARAREAAERNARAELLFIDRLKSDHLEFWRRQRISDIAYITRNPLNDRIIAPFLADPPGGKERQAVLDWMAAILKDSLYRSVVLVDTQGQVRLTLGPAEPSPIDEECDKAREAIRTGHSSLTQLHVAGDSGRLHAVLIVPLIRQDAPGGMGAMLLEIDPDDFLFPLLREWPGYVRSGETVLAERDGEKVIVFDTGEHGTNAGASRAHPVTATNNPAVMAVQGKTGLVEGVDYRGRSILAVVRPVPETSWFLISKIERSAVIAPFRKEAVLIVVSDLVLLVFVSLGYLIWQRRRDVEVYRQRLASEQAARRQEAANLEQREFFERIFEGTLAGHWDWFIPEKRLVMSPRFKASLGYADGEIPNTQEAWQRLVHPEDLPMLFATFEKHVQSRGRTPYNIEVRYLHKDGSLVHVICAGLVIEWDAAGQPLRMVGCHTDLTAWRKAEADLRDSRERMELAFKAAREGIWDWNMETNEVFYSARWKEMLGYTESEIENHVSAWQRLLHPDDLPRAMQVVREVMAGTSEYVMEFRMRHKDGHYVDILSRGFPVRDRPDGRIVRIVGTHLDLTERNKAAAALNESEKRFHTLAEASFEGVVVSDQGTILDCNERFAVLFGGQREQFVGRKITEFMLPEEIPAIIERLRAGSSEAIESHARRLDGGIISVEARGRNIVRDGRTLRIDALRDVTESKRIASELRQAKEAAEIANHAKSDFLANMSHELRTPLNAVIGFSEMLADQTFGPVNPKQTRYLNNVLEAARHLLSLINDILDLSKVEAGKMEMVRRPLRLKGVTDQVMELVRGRALKHDLRLTQVVPEDLEVPADERMLKQILFNLFSNATKFTPDGGSIGVTARRLEDAVQISVSDTGVGVRPEDRERIFEQFEQADSSLSRKHKGTGLGLALCRKFIAMHGGRLWVESAGEGRGSTFHFTLPLIPPPAEETAA